MKTIDIESLLAWTYLRELPKAADAGGRTMPTGAGLAWGSVSRFGDLMAVIDEPDVRNRYGVVPDFSSTAQPHRDAIAAWEAVKGLDDLDLDLPGDWYPLSDLGDLGDDGRGAVARGLDRIMTDERSRRRRLRAPPRRLIEKHAILGGCPDWRADVPERKFVLSANGKPAWFRKSTIVTDTATFESEVDGWNERRRRPHADAYRKTWLDPDPVFAVIDRAEYELWRAALELVTDMLAGRLAEHRVTPSPRPLRPWEEGMAQGATVLPDLRHAPVPA